MTSRKTLIKRLFVAAATMLLLIQTPAHSALIIHWDANEQTGSLTVTEDITLTVSEQDFLAGFVLKGNLPADSLFFFFNDPFEFLIDGQASAINEPLLSTKWEDEPIWDVETGDGTITGLTSDVIDVEGGATIIIQSGSWDMTLAMGAADSFTLHFEGQIAALNQSNQIMSTSADVIPEPSAAILLGSALLLGGALTRRKRQ